MSAIVFDTEQEQQGQNLQSRFPLLTLESKVLLVTKISAMIELLKTTQGKLLALLIFYIPFFSALFFRFFEGKTFESPIGGCCLSMQGLVAAGYVLFTVWIVAPASVIFLIWRFARHPGGQR